MKKAFITGITGQDGAYLAQFLLERGYQVFGMKRRSSSFNTQRIDHLVQDPNYSSRLNVFYGDLTDSTNIFRIINEIKPDEIYNLAAMSHVKVSFEAPEYTADSDAIGTLRILEAVKTLDLIEKTRIYQASTSELYGKVQEIPQTETTPFYPRSPYAVAKLYAYWITKNYREAYGIFASNGILFNHESPLRGETFVTRKITMGVANIALGLQKEIVLGNLDSKRDWGHAREYVEGMYKILQADSPDDFVLATGVTQSVREFVRLSFQVIGIEVEFEGEGVSEIGIAAKNNGNYPIIPGTALLRVDAKYYRPTEVDVLLGDPTKANRVLGWHAKCTLEELVREMVESDIVRSSKFLNGNK